MSEKELIHCPNLNLANHQVSLVDQMIEIENGDFVDQKSRAVLCTMGLGSGKTLTAINAAESLLYHSKNSSKINSISGVLVITNKVLIQEFKNDLKKTLTILSLVFEYVLAITV